jgi:flagellar biosynthesis/type III secretory pathway chaperone
MSVPDLAAVLWRQRDHLERLVYRLECEQMMMASGRTRFLAVATGEVEALLDELGVVELQRAAVAGRVATEAGLPADATLEQIATVLQPPWTDVLVEHRNALISLTSELAVLAETNKHLMSAGMKAVEAALASLGVRQGTTSIGYDAQGRSEAIAGHARSLVDRSL